MSEYEITICLKSNMHIGSGFGFARIIDHMSIEDAEGFAYIPGSTIKGKLKSICKKIALTLGDTIEDFLNKEDRVCQSLESKNGQQEVCKHNEPSDRCVICRLFGSPFAEGKLVFKDAKLNDSDAEKIRVLSAINPFRVDAQNELKNAVKLSRFRRVSSPQHLFTLESVSKKLQFSGSIHARESLTDQEESLLKYGLKSLTHLGGQKARGLGRIKCISCPELGLNCSEVEE